MTGKNLVEVSVFDGATTDGEKPSVARFTSGPWRYKRGDSFDHGEDAEENGFEIILSGDPASGRISVIHLIRYCEDIWPDDGPQHATAEANARLISAAPALYASLVEMVEIYRDDCPDDEEPTCIRNALATLRKAAP